MQLGGKRIMVVGLGKSGLAACRLLARKGARVVANDRRSADSFDVGDLDALRELGVELALGRHDADEFTAVDRIVVAPGVPPLPALTAAERAGVPIASEIELASWFVQGRIIGITGTNGKSTVTTLVGAMAEATGRATFVGGNLGLPLVDVVDTPAAGPEGLVVAELSSFQLERVERLRVHVAVLLNLSEDHLDRYPTFAAYAAAKARIFHGQRAEDASVVPGTDAACLAMAKAGAAAVHSFGSGQEVRIAEGELFDVVSGLRVPVAELGLSGMHNMHNACAAALAARLAGIAPEVIGKVLREFRGLPHRMQWVRSLGGVDYYDDSKATNVGAALAALQGVAELDRRVVWVAGGKHKGSPYQPLRAALDRCARAVVVLGEAASQIEAALRDATYPVRRVQDMGEAVRQAQQLAQPGDMVLLSPACASFDMFESYAARGRAFQRAVQTLGEVTSWA